MTVLRLIHSVFAGLAATVLTAVFGLSCVVASLLRARRAALYLARLWGRAVLLVCGLPLEVTGQTAIARGRRYVIMANHESALDIPVLLAGLPSSLRVHFLAKRSLFRLPFLGWAMQGMGFVPVDRDDRSRAGETFARAGDIVRQGASLLVFPEETRATDGELLPFKRGGFLMALTAGLPILPVGVGGTREALPPGSRSLHPRRLTLAIGEPIETANRRVVERAALMSEVRAMIERLRGAGNRRPAPDGSQDR